MSAPDTDRQPPDLDAYYRLVFEGLGMALIATDREGKVRLWNSEAARIFGAAADSMLGTSVLSIIPSERRSLARRLMNRTANTGETIQFDFQHRDTHGQSRELAAVIAGIVDEQGLQHGISVCVRDITRRVELQGKLVESRKMAALGEMAGAVAHHFNNILGGAVTGLDFARSANDPAVTGAMLEKVQRSLQRASELVDGLLAFAKEDRLQESLAELQTMITDVVDELQPQIRAAGVTMELDIDDTPSAKLPQSRVRTILCNIAKNGIEAMPDGGVLRIGTTTEEDAVTIRITDSGCGIPESDRRRIFEPFWTTKGVLHREGESQATGLGLAVAYGMIDMLGGTVSVTSQPGRGSCFEVRLPLTQPEA